MAGLGLGLRWGRRLRGLPPRIWHGMCPLHLTKYMVQADRQAGYPSRSVVQHTHQAGYALVGGEDFDDVLQRPGAFWQDGHWLCLLDLLWHGDIWIANFDCLFFRPDQTWENRLAFRLIGAAGIRIVVAPHGGDVNHRTRNVTRFNWIGRYQRDYPDWDVEEQGTTAQRRIRLFCEFADLILGADSTLARFLPRNDLLFKYFPIDCQALQPSDSSGNRVPVIVHAPNHRLTKGTDYLLEAVDRLRSQGIPCELMLVERVPREEALRMYRQADIIADQFCMGAYGMFACEGLALGKPVLTYLDQEHLGDPVFNLPLVNTNPDNLEQVLAVLLQVPQLRRRLGDAGRAAVERFQSVPALAEVWDRIYRHLWWGQPLDLETTTHFSPQRQPRSFTEDPSHLDFWPIPVDDLMPAIHQSLRAASASSWLPGC